MNDAEAQKRHRGRPVTRIMPPLIPDSAGNVVRALSQGPPKTDWKFTKPGGAGFVCTGATSGRSADFGQITENRQQRTGTADNGRGYAQNTSDWGPRRGSNSQPLALKPALYPFELRGLQ